MVSGVASFADNMNSGKTIENTQPLTKYDCGNCVSTARGTPNPKKYGQLCSMYVSRLCSSQPMFTHLYSNE